MIRYPERDDRYQYIAEPRGGPAWPKRCAYCGAMIVEAERLRHTSINFYPPDCQVRDLQSIDEVMKP